MIGVAGEGSDSFAQQVARIDFTMEQVQCLASVARSEVFWSVSIIKPASIAEIAAALDRPANTTTYHVNELVKAGLLIAVGERMSKTRREKLYLKAARAFFYIGSRAPKEYRRYYVNGFLNLVRAMGREMEAVHEVYDTEPDLTDFAAMRRFSFKISREKSLEFKKEVAAVIRKFAEAEEDEGVRINTVFYMSPTLAESRSRLKKKKKPESVNGNS